MENLGTMEPEELLQFLVGSLSCAFVIFLFIIGYVLISRRGDKVKKRANLGTGSYNQPLAAEYSRGEEEEASPIDMGARLAGTGREAWLEEAPSPSPATSLGGEPAPRRGREVLRVVCDPSTGETWVTVAGVRYRSLNDIRDRAVGERALAAITHALRFSNGMVATDQGVMTLKLPPCDTVKVPTPFGVLSDAREPGEMVRLISDPDRGDFCVHVVERCYRQLVNVSDRLTGQCILEAITRLLQFSNGILATNDGLGAVLIPPLGTGTQTPLPTPSTPSFDSQQSAAPHPAAPALISDSQQAAVSPAPLSEQEQFLRQLMSEAPAQAERPVERPSLMSSIRRRRQKPSAEPSPSLNLVEEINRIFQSKLALSPLAKTDAQVEANPDGGVRIRVGTVYYNTPDEVPDADLRHMLKLAIAAWERS